MVKIKIKKMEAILDGGVWSCKDDALLGLLRVTTWARPRTFNYEPDKDLALANYVVGKLGGTVTYQEPVGNYNPNVVY